MYIQANDPNGFIHVSGNLIHFVYNDETYGHCLNLWGVSTHQRMCTILIIRCIFLS